LEVCCRTVAGVCNRRTLFSFFQENQNNFCGVKPAQQLFTDMSWRMFATFFVSIFKPVQFIMPPSSPPNKRELCPQSFNWYPFHTMRILVKLVFVNAAESLASWRALGVHTNRARANEVAYSGFVCLSQCYHADKRALCTLWCSLPHFKEGKKIVNESALSITESPS